jgi:hypothetical protein
LNVGSGGGAAAAPTAGGAPAGGAAAAEEPAAKEEEKEEGKVIHPIAWILLTPGQKRKNQTRIWASVFSTRQFHSSFAFCIGTSDQVAHSWRIETNGQLFEEDRLLNGEVSYAAGQTSCSRATGPRAKVLSYQKWVGHEKSRHYTYTFLK